MLLGRSAIVKSFNASWLIATVETSSLVTDGVGVGDASNNAFSTRKTSDLLVLVEERCAETPCARDVFVLGMIDTRKGRSAFNTALHETPGAVVSDVMSLSRQM